jgi:glyoxylase-like metal-dependent hydrolase (beta-lactamase superfamily II)
MADRNQWYEPRREQVAPGIFRIPLPYPDDGLRAVNVYAITEYDGITLVDGGVATADARIALSRGLSDVGFNLADIKQILVTHAHRDHYTLAVSLRREFGCVIHAGIHERSSLELMSEPGGSNPSAQIDLLRRSGASALAATIERMRPEWSHPDESWELPDHWIIDRTDFAIGARTLRSLHTPGHTRGHLVFLEPTARLFFGGDHVLPHITPSLGFERAPSNSPLREYLTSLRLIRALPDGLLLPAHGPCGVSVHSRVDQLLEHHGARLEATLEAVQCGASTALAVAEQLDWTRYKRSLAELPPGHAMFAVLETLAHLTLLAERGMLKRLVEAGVDRFVPA